MPSQRSPRSLSLALAHALPPWGEFLRTRPVCSPNPVSLRPPGWTAYLTHLTTECLTDVLYMLYVSIPFLPRCSRSVRGACGRSLSLSRGWGQTEVFEFVFYGGTGGSCEEGLFVCLSVWLFGYLSVPHAICLFGCLFVCLYLGLYIRQR
jgi:hypothetical protein